jgi:hypothetical protein
MSVCIFCLSHKSRCLPDNCTYKGHHEFPGEESAKEDKPAPKVKVDLKLCIKCGMHPKNPKAAGCEHEYPK